MVGKKVEKVVIKQGWGSWAGEGVDNSQLEQRKEKADALRAKKIEALK